MTKKQPPTKKAGKKTALRKRVLTEEDMAFYRASGSLGGTTAAANMTPAARKQRAKAGRKAAQIDVVAAGRSGGKARAGKKLADSHKQQISAGMKKAAARRKRLKAKKKTVKKQ